MIWYFKEYFIKGNEITFYIYIISILIMILLISYFGIKENKK